MENLIQIEFRNIQSIYSIEFIRKCVGKSISLLNNFKEYYKNVEVKPIDVLSFKKNNYGKGVVKARTTGSSWRRKNRFRGKDIEKYFVNSYIRQIPANDTEKIRKTVISHLNKLNDKKFTIIVKEFIDHLEEQMFYETYDIINSEIMNKVFTDNHYIDLYAKLVKELIINKKWQKKMFNVIHNTSESDDYGFYWCLNRLDTSYENEFVGPFDTEAEAIDDALKQYNYKASFCVYIEDKFRGREVFLNEIMETAEEFDLNVFSKNKYSNFLKMVYWTVEYGIFNSKVLHYSLLTLLDSSDIESFALMYEFTMVNKLKLNKDTQNFYEERLNSVIQTVQIIPRIKFKLQNFFKLKLKSSNIYDALALPSSGENSVNDSIKVDISKKSMNEQNIECIIAEYPITQDYDASIELFRSLKAPDDYPVFISKFIYSVLDSKESISNHLVEMFKMIVRDFDEFSVAFGDFICGQMVQLYAEYEVDYPKCGRIFSNIIKNWITLGKVDRTEFLMRLRSKNIADDDEKYNMELFQENVIVLL